MIGTKNITWSGEFWFVNLYTKGGSTHERLWVICSVGEELREGKSCRWRLEIGWLIAPFLHHRLLHLE